MLVDSVGNHSLGLHGRQQSDALTEDCTTLVGMLRFCLRQGEYQLCPEQTILQRAADDKTAAVQKHREVL